MFWLGVYSLALIAVAFLIGCLLGCLLRRMFAPPETALRETSPAVKDVVLVAKTEPIPTECPASQVVPVFEEVEIIIPDENVEAAERADAVGKRPKVLAAPVDNRPDNLKRIKGIGPKNEETLNRFGVFHFGQIAAWSDEEVTWIGTFLAFPGRIEREEWVAQAATLAKGEDTAFFKTR